MARSFFSNCVGEDYIDQNAPNNIISNGSNKLHGNYRLLKYFNLDEVGKRELYGAEMHLDIEKLYNSSGESTDSAEIAIELYSLSKNLSVVTYNNFINNAVKYKWYGTTYELKRTVSEGYQAIKLDEGITGISQAIKSGGYIVLSIRSIAASIVFDDSGYLDVYTYSLAPTVSHLYPNGNSIYKNKQQEFIWDYSGDLAEQKSYEIGWSANDGKTWNTKNVVSSKNSHTFEAETFPEGIIRWRVKVTSEDDRSSEYFEAEFNSVIQRPAVSIGFPNGINISNEKDQIFTWEYFGEDLQQKSYEIGLSSDGGTTWESIQKTSSETYHVFAANSIPTGHLLWRIRATNSAGYSSDYVYGEFDAVGQSEVPIIESISQNAIPTITWTASEQEAFEIQIKGQNVNYESGLIPGKDTRSYRPNIMLQNGKYEFKIRILNSYGRITDWGGTTFFLSASKPSGYPLLMLKENDLHGVSLSGSGISGKGFYVRKEIRYQTIVYENTYMINGMAWETRNISVGDYVEEIGDITAPGYFVHRQQVEKNDVLILCPGWYVSDTSYLYSDRLVVTNENHIVVDTISFDDLDDLRKYTFKEDGYFFLSTTAPESSGVSLFEIHKTINGNLPESFEDKEVIIAEYEEGKTIVDCDLIPGMNYLYVLRDHVNGYTDSAGKTYFCDFDGVIFQDIEKPENMIHIHLNENEYVGNENLHAKNTTYKSCVGREYPVKESSFQKTEKIIVTGFLNVEKSKKAYDMFLADKTVLYRDESHCCYADICNFKKKRFFDKGYIVEIVFERIDGNKEVKLV